MFSLSKDFEQLSFIERILQVNELPKSNPAKFLELLNTHIDLATLIPSQFRMKYNSSQTNDRTYSLESILSMLLLMQHFKIDRPSTFILILHFAPTLREFCRLPVGRIPDESVLSSFKITFERELKLFFDNLSNIVMDIFTGYNESLPDNSPDKGLSEILIKDTTGLKPKVKENNPKYLQSQINKQKTYKKYLETLGKAKDFNVFSAAYKNMARTAHANDAIRLGYANGHFGYFYKFGMLANGFGIPLHLHFFDDDFYNNLPADFDSPTEQKYVYDNASLRPVLSSFFKRIGNNKFTIFMADSEFDSYDNYRLLHTLGFQKVFIPLNSRNTQTSGTPIPINAQGVPCCPKDPTLPFISDGSCKGENRSLRFKFVCPLSRKENNIWVCDCNDKCRDTNSTVTTYTYPSGDLRVFFGVHRGTREWNDGYKKRTVIEREFSSMKSHPILDRPNTYNCASLRADVCLNAASKLITVILAFALGKPEFMRNLNMLVKAA